MSTCGTCKHWKRDAVSCLPHAETGLCTAAGGALCGFHVSDKSSSCDKYAKQLITHFQDRINYYNEKGHD